VQKLYWRFLGIVSGYRKRKWNKISRELDRCGYRAGKLIIIPIYKRNVGIGRNNAREYPVNFLEKCIREKNEVKYPKKL